MPVLQGPVPGLVLGEYVLALAQLLPQVSHLLAEGRVLLLQERSPDGDLILLQPPGITGALGCHVVLSAPGPVLVILLISYTRKKKQDIRFQQRRVSARALAGLRVVPRHQLRWFNMCLLPWQSLHI